MDMTEMSKIGRAVVKFRMSDGEFDELVRVVSDGGMVTEWAKERGMSYTALMQWIHRTPERAEVWRGVEVARSQWFVQSIIGELKTLGLVDIREAYTEAGELKDVRSIPEPVARAIVGIETFEETDSEGNTIGYTKKVKFSDKLRALELLGKHLQMFIDNTRVLFQGKLTLEDLVCKSAGVAAAVPAIDVEAITKGDGDGETIQGADEQGSAGADSEGSGGDKTASSGTSAQSTDAVDSDGLAPI